MLYAGASSIECYDPLADKWTTISNMSTRRQQFGAAVLGNRVYIVGGRDGLKTLNSVECFDPRTRTWTSAPPIATHRHGLG